jgi:queuosine precursor transporter
MESAIRNKKTFLFIVLSGIFLTNAIIAEVIGVKIFSLEALLGSRPANIKLLGDLILDFNLTAGVLVWPVVFITTDIINEYFGKEAVRKISYLTAVFLVYIFLIIWIATLLPPAEFWLEINKLGEQNAFFNINYSFSRIFSQGLGIIIGSLTAFLLGQIIDASIFHKIRKSTGEKMIWLRATGSTLISQLFDSFVVLFVAFYVFGGEHQWTIAQVISVGIINYVYKFSVALLLTPVLYVAHYIIDNYLGKDLSKKIIKETASE